MDEHEDDNDVLIQEPTNPPYNKKKSDKKYLEEKLFVTEDNMKVILKNNYELSRNFNVGSKDIKTLSLKLRMVWNKSSQQQELIVT
jgi:hypothetical protein